MRKKIIYTLSLLGSLLYLLLPMQSYAASGVIYISPSSASVQVGNTITVALRINPGTTVNAVQATIDYNASDLQFVSTTLSAFPVCAQNSGGGGTVTLSCAILAGSTSTDSLIANISFKALAGSGSTSLQITNANAANNGTYTNPSVAGETISFTSPPAPAPSPTPTPVSSSPAPKTNTPSYTYTAPTTPTQPTKTSTTPVKATPVTEPKVSLTLKVQSVGYTQAGIHINTNVPVQIYIQYGESANNLSQTTKTISVAKNQLISLQSASLIPGKTYFYQVVAKDQAGTITKSPVHKITLKGYTVNVTVLDEHNHPISNASVVLHSTHPRTTRTNSNGVATFYNVTPGLHHLEYTFNKTTYSKAVYVQNSAISLKNTSATVPAQNDAVILSGYQQPYNVTPVIVAVIVTLLVILAPIIYLLLNKKLHEGIKPTGNVFMPTKPTTFKEKFSHFEAYCQRLLYHEVIVHPGIKYHDQNRRS